MENIEKNKTKSKCNSDDQILTAILNPELPFENIESSEKLTNQAKVDTQLLEAQFDPENLKKYKNLQNLAIKGNRKG